MGIVRKRLVALLVAAGTLAAWLTIPTVSVQRSWLGQVLVVGSESGALVLVSRGDAGWQASPARHLWKVASGFLSSGFPFPDRRQYMDTVSVSRDSVRPKTWNGFGHFWGVANDEIIAIAGGRVCRWRDGGFVPLSEPELKAIQPKVHGISSVPRGWSVLAIAPTVGRTEGSFRVGDRTCHLRRWRDGRIEHLTLLDASGAILGEWSADMDARVISATEYRRLFAPAR